MTKRKPLEKDEARARRDRLMDTATHAKLSVTDGVREMRAISGLTQDQFAEHRGISTRVVKALELGKANPTVATLNRIAEFYGLEVGLVPRKHLRTTAAAVSGMDGATVPADPIEELRALVLNHQKSVNDLLTRVKLHKLIVDPSGQAMLDTPVPGAKATRARRK